jgi:selenophosphate synthase
VAPDVRLALLDPQTSGGLLVAVSGDRVGTYLSLVPGATEIGDVVQPGTHRILLV